jgi:CSLREA domain-containing protein
MNKIFSHFSVAAFCGFSLLLIVACAVEASAATFTVTKTADTDDGVCDADCSLREAIAAANSASSDDLVNFDATVFNVARTITLSGNEISILGIGTLTINGTGSAVLDISGNSTSRIFVVDQSANLIVNGVKLRHGTGHGTNNGNGGCILNYGKLSLVQTMLQSCYAPISGGAIYSTGSEAELYLINSTLSTNSASVSGGGITNFNKLSLVNSTITNGAGSTAGGILNDNSQFGGLVTISNSTIDDNNANSDASSKGGGILNLGTISISNTTICNNFSSADGGGIFNGGTIDITNATISDNRGGNGPVSAGGGIFNVAGNTVRLRNSIIAGNLVRNTVTSDFTGTVTSQGYNLIESVLGTSIEGIFLGNVLGVNPDLLPIANNGGPTRTVAPQPGSRVIDAGSPLDFPSTDQRGILRTQDGDLNGSVRPDIGAYERQVTTFTVTKTADTNDGNCNADCSLREAIAVANVASTADDVIVFDPGMFGTPQTISLILGHLQITSTNGTLLIHGTGANLLTISGNNQSSIFRTNTNAIGAVDGVKITAGHVSGGGGGIANLGRFALMDSVLSQNSAEYRGGGIYNNAVMTISNTVLMNNDALSGGGGILNEYEFAKMTITSSTVRDNSGPGGIVNSGALTISNSTITGNDAGIGTTAFGNQNSTLTIINSTIANNSNTRPSGIGGGISNDGSAVFLLNVTVTGNSVTSTLPYGGGGGVCNSTQNYPGTITARNTIIANNNAVNGIGTDYFGVLMSQGYNLVENTSNMAFAGTLTGNITGQDPRVGVLANNGGLTQTVGLMLGSPAIDAGDPNAFLMSDQRGAHRPVDGDLNGTSVSDIGAFEYRSDVAPMVKSPFDFDGDGKTDIGIYRPNGVNGSEWWINRGSNDSTFATQFGSAADKVVSTDFTGDGKADVAFWRPSTGYWYVLRSEDLSYYAVPFGSNGDVPVPADYDGDGKADRAVFRPSTNTWYIEQSGGGTRIEAFGATGDKPVPADYDGDGKADIAIFRPTAGSGSGEWWINRSTAGLQALVFGVSTDKPVQGDYTGDGKADIAFWRPSTGDWYVLRSENLTYYSTPFGGSSDIPAPGDYDGDGKFDTAVYRPAETNWYVQRSTAGTLIRQFGSVGDQPLPNAYVP